MRRLKGFLEIEKIVPLNIRNIAGAEVEASRLVDNFLEEDRRMAGYLSSFQLLEKDFEVLEGEDLFFNIIKKAIDSFDPYFVHPESYDEYDVESRRISEEIKYGMSRDEIGEIMKEEFNRSFSADFSRQDFSYPAGAALSLLEDSFIGSEINRGKKLYAYLKLSFYKKVELDVSEDLEEEFIGLVHDRLKSSEKAASPLASFNISDYWLLEID